MLAAQRVRVGEDLPGQAGACALHRPGDWWRGPPARRTAGACPAARRPGASSRRHSRAKPRVNSHRRWATSGDGEPSLRQVSPKPSHAWRYQATLRVRLTGNSTRVVGSNQPHPHGAVGGVVADLGKYGGVLVTPLAVPRDDVVVWLRSAVWFRRISRKLVAAGPLQSVTKRRSGQTPGAPRPRSRSTRSVTASMTASP